jgi:hypothetical protein
VLGIIDAGCKLARRKPAEHHRMHRPDARACEHPKYRFRHHRHVENDAVALPDAEIAQHRGEDLHLELSLPPAGGPRNPPTRSAWR